jgi:chromosome segregation ATPase
LRKIAKLERKIREGESQIAKKEGELQHLQKQERRDKRHGFQRQDSYEKAVTSTQGSALNKDQEIRSLKRQIDTLRWEDDQRIFEISSNTEEIRQLKESIEQLRNQKSAAETEVANISEKARHFDIQYCTEKEHSQRLRDQIRQLQQQLEVAPQPEPDDKAPSGEENSAKIIARLQYRIKTLNDNVSKLQEHSVEQSRAVLHLKQQAEMSQVQHCTCTCVYVHHRVQ